MKSIPILEGSALLVRRKNTPRWQVQYKAGGKWRRTSTKQADVEKAKQAAVEIVLDALHKEKFGLPIVTRSFKSLAQLAIKRMTKELTEGQGKVVFKDYITALNNYFVLYFGSTHITKIDYEALSKFDDWRTEKMGKHPKSSTVNTHTAALNRVWDEAMMLGYITKSEVPVIQNKGDDTESRPAFSIPEYRKLHRFMRSWSEKKTHTSNNQQMRLLLRDMVLILANTGIRTGTETYPLKWKHLTLHKDNGNEYLEIYVNGKTKERRLIARQRCRGWFERIYKRAEDLDYPTFEKLLEAGDDRYVFRLANGKHSKSLHQTFKKLLIDAGLLKDPVTGKDRTLYSLRHSYGTWALNKGIPIHTVAVQMGTSVKMLEKFYSKHRAFDARRVLSGVK